MVLFITMITLNEISKEIGARTLFDNVSASFNSGHRYGLTGPNGAGKSTLLKIMLGLEDATSGTVTLPKKVGFLKQNIEDFRTKKVLDVVIMGNNRLWEAISERDNLYEEEMTDAIGMRLGEIEEIIAEEDGYSADSAAEILLIGMGITIHHHEKTMNTIPLDLQFRVLLCQALFGEPEALLLDEPTNHLDLEAIGWLENFLHHYEGTLIVTSHDRHFLNAVTTQIADIDYETVITYPGNYDQMLITKTSIRERTEAANKSKDKKITQLKEYVAKFGAGTRASQVQSRVREIDRLQPQELKKSNIQRPYIRFILPAKQSGKIAIKAINLDKCFDDKKLINHFSHEFMSGDKVGIIGNNGLGKTTLSKILAGILKPDHGKIEHGHNTKIGYFPQNHSEIVDKSIKISSFDWLKNIKPNAYDQDIRGVMGKMLFVGDDAFKEISKLSGGETARLIFAALMLQNNNIIILDEPNNHLDLESVSALSWGLNEFKGTIILVSHDRNLMQNVANKIISLEKDGCHFFDGTLEEYRSTTVK